MALSGALGTGCGSDDDVSSRGDAGFFDAGEGDGGTRDATMEDGTPDAGLGDPLYLLIGAVFTPERRATSSRHRTSMETSRWI